MREVWRTVKLREWWQLRRCLRCSHECWTRAKWRRWLRRLLYLARITWNWRSQNLSRRRGRVRPRSALTILPAARPWCCASPSSQRGVCLSDTSPRTDNRYRGEQDNKKEKELLNCLTQNRSVILMKSPTCTDSHCLVLFCYFASS